MVARGGNGNQVLQYVADLPTAGKWRLEFHIPKIADVPDQMRFGLPELPSDLPLYGEWEIEVLGNEVSTRLPFSLADSVVGWNVVGDLDLPRGDVKVLVSNASSSGTAISDAIRWSRVEE